MGAEALYCGLSMILHRLSPCGLSMGIYLPTYLGFFMVLYMMRLFKLILRAGFMHNGSDLSTVEALVLLFIFSTMIQCNQ